MDKYEIDDHDWVNLCDAKGTDRRVCLPLGCPTGIQRTRTMMAEANYGVAIRPFAEKAEEAIKAHRDGFNASWRGERFGDERTPAGLEHRALLDALKLLPEPEPEREPKPELTPAMADAMLRIPEVIERLEKAGDAVYDVIHKLKGD